MIERDTFLELIADAVVEAGKAMQKFPQPNYVISKVAEEAGEVVKAAIHCAEKRETMENLRGEMKQLIAMLYRLWMEGDKVHGLGPVGGVEVREPAQFLTRKHDLHGHPLEGHLRAAHRRVASFHGLPPDGVVEADMVREVLITLTNHLCRKCGGEMEAGFALKQTFTSGAPDFPGSDIVTMSAGGPGRMVPCRKCRSCGWSVTI